MNTFSQNSIKGRVAEKRSIYEEPEMKLALAAEPLAPALQAMVRRPLGRPAKAGQLTTAAR